MEEKDTVFTVRADTSQAEGITVALKSEKLGYFSIRAASDGL